MAAYFGYCFTPELVESTEVMGAFGFQLFRATTRYVIVFLCIVLMYAARRLSEMELKGKYTPHLAAFLLVLIALWDQTPPQVTLEELEATARAVAETVALPRKMEERLPSQMRSDLSAPSRAISRKFLGPGRISLRSFSSLSLRKSFAFFFRIGQRPASRQ